MLQDTVKEEGEITDDENCDKQQSEVAVSLSVNRNALNRKRRRGSSPDLSVPNDAQKFLHSRKCRDHSVILAQSVSPAVKKRKQAASNCGRFTRFSPSLSLYPCTSNDSSIGICLQHSEKFSYDLCKRREVPDTIVIDDDSDSAGISDAEVAGSVKKQDDDDLDELQLRRDALNSAVKCNKSDISCSSNITTMPNPNRQKLMKSSSDTSNLIKFNVKQTLGANGINSDRGVTIPSTSVIALMKHNHLGYSMPGPSTDNSVVPALSQENTTMSCLLSAAACAHSVGHSMCTSSSMTVEPPNSAYPAGDDNCEAVEMDLDSGSDCGGSYCEQQPSKWTSGSPEQNTLVLATHATVLTHSWSNNVASLPLVSVADGSDLVVHHAAQISGSSSVGSDKLPGLLHTESMLEDFSNLSNLEQVRVDDKVDEKSTLLLRVQVLQSLSCKRQHQSQSHSIVNKLSDRTSESSLLGGHSAKRTVNHLSDNQLTVHLPGQLPLPVHEQVIISLTPDESSDSDDMEKQKLTDSSDCSTVAKSDGVDGMSNNVSKMLRKIREAAEEPKSQDCNTAVSKQVGTAGTTSQIEHRTCHPISTTRLSMSKNVSSRVPFSPSKKIHITKKLGAVCSEGVSDAVKVDPKCTSSQRNVVSSLENKITCKKRKLQQQKIALSKAKLKMARKTDQVGAAEKRVMKLREQLVAAEKITNSSKKQMDNLRSEIMIISQKVDQCQKNITTLEASLHMARRNVAFSADLLPYETSLVESQSLSVKVGYKAGSSVLNYKSVSPVSPGATHDQDLKNSMNTLNSEHTLKGSDVCSVQLQDSHPVSVACKAINYKTLRQKVSTLSLTNEGKEESNSASAEHRLVKGEPKSEDKFDDKVETHIAVNSLSPDITEKTSASKELDLYLLAATESDVISRQSGDGCAISPETDISYESWNEFRIPSDRKIKEIQYHYNSMLDRNVAVDPSSPFELFIADPMFAFVFTVNTLSSDVTDVNGTTEVKSHTSCSSYRPYRSSLLCFKSYRFGEYRHEKGIPVMSETFSHKLHCNIPLCQFDLMGKCLDDNCAWQHHADYALSDREHLLDILSYYPSVVGLADSVPMDKYEQQLNLYIDKFLKDDCVLLSSLEQCLWLIDHVRAAAGLADYRAVCTSVRYWKLPRNKQHLSDDRSDLPFGPDYFSDADTSTALGNLGSADDIRYWMFVEANEIMDIEAAVADRPNDDSLWIRLAHAKMVDKTRSASHDDCITYGLNILTRALEANPSNSKLWRHYLDLYMERSDSNSDVSSLYRQAIQYAPSYEIFWKFLKLANSYSQNMNICKQLRQYLCSPMCRDDAATRSHHLIETVLYQSALCTMSGRFRDGLQVIQAIVQSKASVIWQILTYCDRIVLWLSFIYLYEWRQLPEALFDATDSNPGPLARKEPFVIPFRFDKKTRISYDTLLQLFFSAFSACETACGPACNAFDEYLLWLSALYRSRLLLELSCHRWRAAQQLCEQILHKHSWFVDVWLFLIQLIVATSSEATDDAAVCSTLTSTVEKALVSNPDSIMLFLTAVCALIQCGEVDGALSFAERCSISLFEINQLDATTLDPNLLYCCLLGLPLPPNYIAPPLRSSMLQQYVADQQANLWMIYCLLLDLQGAHDQATEAYHWALSRLSKTNDIRRLWLAFLRRSVALISGHLSWLTAPAGLDEKRKLWQQFEVDVNQALASLPVRRSLPHSSQMWDDYSRHNEIIELYVSTLSDSSMVLAVYEKYLRQMPGNVELAVSAVRNSWGRERLQLCRGLCMMALQSCPKAGALWNISLTLNGRTANVGLMRSLYANATTMLPFSASLWKTYIMFEIINKSPRHVQEVLAKCRRLQLNVSCFLDRLLK